ncbi:MAG: N-acetylneuraminate synthase family protein [Spirochaetes bacterium]|nr:N-acetylneuraminate synthase family protein [Spirochaetota bacterium]
MLFKKSAANPTERNLSTVEKPFLVAEFGLNHNRDLNLAKRMVDAAKASGVDAVKLQSYTTKYFINRQFENVRVLYDIFAGLELAMEFHSQLRDYTAAQGLIFFSTPLTVDWVEKLDNLGAPCFKVASGDINNWQLFDAIIATGKPVIVSAGAASAEEVQQSINFLSKANSDFALLHCVSLYPTPETKANIGRIALLKNLLPQAHPALMGFSDHTEGCNAAFAAVAAGASIIEKHFTLDKNLPGPDQKMSFDPSEMKKLREAIDLAHAIRGNATTADCHAEETASDYYGKRSLYEFEGQTLAMRPRHTDFPRP